MDFSYAEIMDQIRMAEMIGDVDAEEYWHEMLECAMQIDAIDEGDDYEDDGQPSEMQEWQDFDRDC
jgi:hypothetical protein